MSIPDRAVYATQPHPLRRQIANLLQDAEPLSIEGDIYAMVVPDTNLLQSGKVAADLYKTLEGRQYDTVILIAPSHEGRFRRLNICSVDTYHTPLGELPVNDRMRHELCDEDDDIFLDDSGHFHTEGIDVQLPYLQHVLDAFDIVPIVMGDESPDLCRELGHAVGEVMYNQKALIVASADILEATEDTLNEFKTLLEKGDVSRLMTLLNSERVRMEGIGAVLVALIAATHRRANRVRVTHLDLPHNGKPGAMGAFFWRG